MKKRVVLLLVAVIFMAGMIFVDSASQAQQKTITWTGQSCLPPGAPVAVGMQDLSERIKDATGGRLIWSVKPAGSVCPATKEWQAINKGTLDFAATGGSYLVPEIPFGSIVSQRVGAKLSAEGHWMWFEAGGGRELINKWYKKLGYKFINVGGLHGLPEGWIHLNKPLKGPQDLKGLKMRASGDCGIVLSRMGVGTVFMPLGEIFENMKRGIIDAYECSNPAFDYDMKLYEAGKYYYLSPTRAPFETYEIMVEASKWEALPADLKAIVVNCIRGAEVAYHARLIAANEKAVQGFKEKGVIVENLPSSIDDAFVPEAVKYLKEVAAKHESMNEVLTSQLKFEEMWKNLYGLASPGK